MNVLKVYMLSNKTMWYCSDKELLAALIMQDMQPLSTRVVSTENKKLKP